MQCHTSGAGAYFELVPFFLNTMLSEGLHKHGLSEPLSSLPPTTPVGGVAALDSP